MNQNDARKAKIKYDLVLKGGAGFCDKGWTNTGLNIHQRFKTRN